jgi:hypothetical protein
MVSPVGGGGANGDRWVGSFLLACDSARAQFLRIPRTIAPLPRRASGSKTARKIAAVRAFSTSGDSGSVAKAHASLLTRQKLNRKNQNNPSSHSSHRPGMLESHWWPGPFPFISPPPQVGRRHSGPQPLPRNGRWGNHVLESRLSAPATPNRPWWCWRSAQGRSVSVTSHLRCELP